MAVLIAALTLACTPAVHDGDTFRLCGERVRIVAIDTPELRGRCPYERTRAVLARERLRELLASGTVVLEGSGRDRFGRLLRRVRVNGRDVGEVLRAEGLARRWTGRRESWC